MNYEQILFDVSEGIATITLNRPEKLNAWTARMDQQVRAAIAAAMAAARPGDVVLLAGKGHEKTIERAGADEPWDEVTVAREALTSLGYPQHT